MGDPLVLCYHAVSDRWPAVLSIPAERMREQLYLLVSRGYRGSTMSDAVRASGGRKTLVVTFDDAFRSVLERAKPILDELGLPGTVYVPTAFPDREPLLRWPGIDCWIGSEYESDLAPLSWSELSAMADAGWEIGSHTLTHPSLTAVDDTELERQLVESRAQCEAAIGLPCRSLAYPYGDHDSRVCEAARSAGYQTAVTLRPGRAPSSAQRWPRVGVYRSDDLWRFRLKIAPPSRQLRATRLWRELQARNARRSTGPAGDSDR